MFRPPAEAVARGMLVDDDVTQHESRGTFRAEDRAQSPEVIKQGAGVQRAAALRPSGPAEGEKHTKRTRKHHDVVDKADQRVP